MKKATLYAKTAEALRTSKDYRWSRGDRCNLAHLIEVARGSRPTQAEYLQDCRGPWCRAGENNHLLRWLASEYGITRTEVESIEMLSDRTIVRRLARRGILPAPMFNRNRHFVAAYLDVMASRSRRAARKTQPSHELAAR